MEVNSIVFSVIWLGILTALSPCPLATNVAAIGFISKNGGKISRTVFSGIIYAFGRVLAYVLIGLVLNLGFSAAPELSNNLQKYMNLLMGPLLVLVAMILLEMIKIKFKNNSFISKKAENFLAKSGFLGPLFLGIIFALSLCPSSAAILFGSVIPLAVKAQSSLLVLSVYGIATSLPVLFFAVLLAFSANRMVKIYDKISSFDKIGQKITGYIFLIIGIYFTLTLTLGL